MAGLHTKDSSHAPASASPPVPQKGPAAKLDSLTGLPEHLAPRVLDIKKYYDTLSGTTSNNCFFHLEPRAEKFFIKRARANVRGHFRDIVNVMYGRNTGLLVICLKSEVSSTLRWLVMDLCPDPDAWKVGNAITTWGGWNAVVKVFSAKTHKESIYDDLKASLGQRAHPMTIVNDDLKANQGQPVPPLTITNATFDTDDEEADDDYVDDESVAEDEEGKNDPAAAETNTGEPHSRPRSEAKDENAAEDTTPIEAENQTSIHPAVIPRPNKRPRSDDTGTLFDRTLAVFDHWRDTLKEACRSSNDMTEEVTKLKADNERLKEELKTKDDRALEDWKQKAESWSLTLGEASSKITELEKRGSELQESETQLEAEKVDMQDVIDALRVEATLTKSKLDKVKAEERLLKTDNEALQDLVGIWLAGVDVDKFLKEVREGKDVKGAFFAASMNK